MNSANTTFEQLEQYSELAKNARIDILDKGDEFVCNVITEWTAKITKKLKPLIAVDAVYQTLDESFQDESLQAKHKQMLHTNKDKALIAIQNSIWLAKSLALSTIVVTEQPNVTDVEAKKLLLAAAQKISSDILTAMSKLHLVKTYPPTPYSAIDRLSSLQDFPANMLETQILHYTQLIVFEGEEPPNEFQERYHEASAMVISITRSLESEGNLHWATAVRRSGGVDSDATLGLPLIMSDNLITLKENAAIKLVKDMQTAFQP